MSDNKFAKEYEEYKQACYGDIDLHLVQAKEVKQAFYAGAFGAMNMLIDTMEKGPDKIDNMAKDLYRELTTVLRPKEQK